MLMGGAEPPPTLNALRTRLIELGRQERAGVARAQAAAARLAALNAAEAQLKARTGANQKALVRLLSALETYRRDPPPALLVSPNSARDAVNAAILMKAITPELQRRARALAAEGEALNRVRREILIRDGDLLGAEHDVADRRAELDALADEKARIEGPADPAALDLARKASASNSVAAAVAALATPESATDPAPTNPVPPLPGPVTRRFGDVLPGHGRSQGWSWRAAEGALVQSPAAGRVVYAGPLKGWGFVVILQSGGGYHFVLAGLSRGVAIGVQVAAGEPLGRMARSPSGPGGPSELYLEVRRGARPIDPSLLFAGDRG